MCSRNVAWAPPSCHIWAFFFLQTSHTWLRPTQGLTYCKGSPSLNLPSHSSFPPRLPSLPPSFSLTLLAFLLTLPPSLNLHTDSCWNFPITVLVHKLLYNSLEHSLRQQTKRDWLPETTWRRLVFTHCCLTPNFRILHWLLVFILVLAD